MILSISNASRKERDILFREVSLKNNINQVIIEKDFWVCFILDHLFNFSTYKEKLFFKGGTSLSKCYNIIKRFSEDVDLVIDPSLVGIQETVMWEDRSNNSQHKFNEFINEKTNRFLSEEFIPTLKNELNLRGYHDFNLVMDENDPLSVLFIYDKINQDSYIKPEVKLEMGTLAAKIPLEVKMVEPYI